MKLAKQRTGSNRAIVWNEFANPVWRKVHEAKEHEQHLMTELKKRITMLLMEVREPESPAHDPWIPLNESFIGLDLIDTLPLIPHDRHNAWKHDGVLCPTHNQNSTVLIEDVGTFSCRTTSRIDHVFMQPAVADSHILVSHETIAPLNHDHAAISVSLLYRNIDEPAGEQIEMLTSAQYRRLRSLAPLQAAVSKESVVSALKTIELDKMTPMDNGEHDNLELVLGRVTEMTDDERDALYLELTSKANAAAANVLGRKVYGKEPRYRHLRPSSLLTDCWQRLYHTIMWPERSAGAVPQPAAHATTDATDGGRCWVMWRPRHTRCPQAIPGSRMWPLPLWTTSTGCVC